MAHREHLFSLRLAHALRESCVKEPYNRSRFFHDVMAGAAVGVIAIPLAMALAIASGVPPQYGLYTAIIAGIVIAATGGSRLSVSGPTAAFVVILFPVAQKYGLSGLALATLMSGFLLLAFAYFRLGRLIEYIPESVTMGFTLGIATVLLSLQLNDLFGLNLTHMPEHFVEKMAHIWDNRAQVDWPSVVVGVLTLLSFIGWKRLGTKLPPHLFAVLIGVITAYALQAQGYSVETIDTRFSYVDANGEVAYGIPPYFPDVVWPWLLPSANGSALEFSWPLFKDLATAAFAMAMLGAIESLLCAVVMDGLTGKRHSANSELLGQGIGNLIVPFFGGITATAAIARSSANFRAGAQSPVASMVHALVVLLGLILFAPWLGHIPMAAMAAVLVMVAWNISEFDKIAHLIRHAPRTDVVVLSVCFLLTVVFDMVIAITTGVLLSAVLFMKEIADMTKVVEITHHKRLVPQELPSDWRVFKIVGPLFFAAADRVYGELSGKLVSVKGVVLYLDGVTVLDAGGLSTTLKFIERCKQDGIQIVFADWQFQPLRTLKRANVAPIDGVSVFTPTLKEGLEWVLQHQHGEPQLTETPPSVV